MAAKTDAPETEVPKTEEGGEGGRPRRRSPRREVRLFFIICFIERLRKAFPETDVPETSGAETDVGETDGLRRMTPRRRKAETDAPKTDGAKTDATETEVPETEEDRDGGHRDGRCVCFCFFALLKDCGRHRRKAQADVSEMES